MLVAAQLGRRAPFTCQLGLTSQCLQCFFLPCNRHIDLTSVCHSFHSSARVEQPEQEAPERGPVPPETGIPVTRRAQAGSLQLSLETPQNKAG